MDQINTSRASRSTQWRHSMSHEQHEAYLARRRDHARGKRPMLESSHDQPNTHRDNMNDQPTGQNENHVNHDEEIPRVRLTHIRQRARTIGIHDHTLQNEQTERAVNNGEELTRMCLNHIRHRAHTPMIRLNDGERVHGRGLQINPNNMEEQFTEAPNLATNNMEDNDDQDEEYDNENMIVGDMQCDAPTIRRVRRVRICYNSARNFHEDDVIQFCQLPPLNECPYCKAKLFHRETFSLCCSKGNIDLPLLPSLPQMAELFSDQTDEGKKFRQNILAYNNVFAFTSMGVHVDERINVRAQYTFRAQGSIYHKIGGLLPNDERRPRYLQAYIYDTEHEIENRLSESTVLDRGIVNRIQHILDQYNPFVHTFRSLGQRQDLLNCRLIIREQPSDRRQYILPSASQVAAIIVGGDNVNPSGRDFVIQTIAGRLQNIQDSVGFYDPMQYPLLLPYGTYGWDINTKDNNNEDMSCCDYYSYMLQIREGHANPLHRGGRLFQQYVVDNYVNIESQILRYIRLEQEKFRKEFRQGLQDSLHAGENNAGNVGIRTILPSSFIGSPRDMYQRYQDAMALVQKYGRPDLFITMTCNPNWEEVKKELLPGQTAQDRPDIVTRVFHAKLEHLKEDIIKKGVLGRVVGHAFVVEFQKRGLPHVHMLVMLEESDKLYTADEYDHIVRAELPDMDAEPQLYDAVCTHMIHGPCGRFNRNLSCMKNGRCTKGYPKPFANFTVQGNEAYPIYRRRANRLSVPLQRRRDVMVDNSWVVPYNPWLLLRYNCHINVEICGSIKSVKYLYKYIYKGPDKVALELHEDPNHDEIRQFVDARWVCAPEALWRIFKFGLNRQYPTVERLQIHIPNMQQVTFNAYENIEDILADVDAQKTMLTEFFTLNQRDNEAREYLYREIPEKYRWDGRRKCWAKRRSNVKVIGRIYSVSPFDAEKFYLRVLLNHVRGPRSFRHLLTVQGILQPTFKQAAEKAGLLENDNSVRDCLLEASTIRMPYALRRLFATILVYCEPTGIRGLWDEFYHFLVEDYPPSSDSVCKNKLLRDLNRMLEQFNKDIRDFDLPKRSSQVDENSDMLRCIQDELSIQVCQEDMDAIDQLNDDQRVAFNTIMNVVERQDSALFFVDGPGGTGKTYLYRALLANLRRMNRIVLATASSGIASTVLPGGRTAHLRFKIPVSVDASSSCLLSKQSDPAELMRNATAIIWDEAPMTHRHAFEAVDRLLRDITDVGLPFGGKIMIFGGDFRQVLPVIPKGTRSELIEASIVKSSFWPQTKILRLRQNMRSINDPQFSEFLLRVGEGNEHVVQNEMIKLPRSMVVPWQGEQSITEIIDEVFPNLGDHVNDARYMVERALITPINDDVDMLNEKIVNMFPGEPITLFSFDYVEDDTKNLYQPEFLNTITVGGLPPHKLTLKIGAPIMLLRNIDPNLGLCNGTRLLCRGSYHNLIDAEIISGQFAGNRVFLPRIPLKPAENVRLPFVLTRKQFPVKLSFSLTINKAQGQTIPHVGVYLPDHVFSHGQLYVALSRGVSRSTTKILVKNASLTGQDGVYTRNVVFKEVLLHSDTSNDASS